MEFLFKKARQLDRQIVWLEAMDTQTEALRFYETMGFETKGQFRLSFDRMHTELRGMVRMVAEV
jgi:ribosomal protein S18 acetylase RimI-like enzyme